MKDNFCITNEYSIIRKGSFTIETACVMPLILLVLMGLIYLSFFVHNRAWLTAAAYESAVSGSMEGIKKNGEIYDTARMRSEELGSIGFFGAENLGTQTNVGKEVQVTYDLDTISSYGNLSWHLRTERKSVVINPVKHIRILRAAQAVLREMGEWNSMRTEYKRDMNHNYLIVYGENEINTDSYQVRMLAGNVIPSLLKCRIQGMDGRFLIYFDITSKQAVNVLYEEKKMGVEDLRLIFGGFVKAMEDAAEYLINPGQFIMSPEYIYTDIEKRQIYFCMMPGYEKDIKEQFQLLTEYILPKIDHQDQDAVILGYGVYKRAMEDSFHLEHIKEELYKTQSSDVNGEKKEKINAKKTEQEMEFAEEETFPEDNENRNEFVREGEDSKEPGRLNPVGVIVPAAVLICGLAAAILKGYLPHVEMETILGVIVIAIAGIMLGLRIIKTKKVLHLPEQAYASGETVRHIEKIRNMPSWNKTEKKTSGKRSGWKEAEGKVSEQKWEDRLYENLSQTVERNQQTNQSQPVNGQKMSDCGQKTSESSRIHMDYGETVVLSAGTVSGPASLVSKEPGELATIYLNEDLTVIGKLETACDAVISLPTVSRIHAKIRKKEENYFLSDMNSRNGTSVNGRLLRPDEEYQLEPEDEVDFAQARYIFLE